MKATVLVHVFAVLAFKSFSQDSVKSMTKEIISVSCKLTAPELQQRKVTVLTEIKKRVVQRVETANGIRYVFNDSDETIDLLTSFIKTERQCCSFFTFSLIVGQPERFISMELSGPEGTKDFIKEEIGF
jgi:hypothetical protein